MFDLQARDHAEQLQLRFGRQPVARLGLARRRAVRQHLVEPARGRHERVRPRSPTVSPRRSPESPRLTRRCRCSSRRQADGGARAGGRRQTRRACADRRSRARRCRPRHQSSVRRRSARRRDGSRLPGRHTRSCCRAMQRRRARSARRRPAPDRGAELDRRRCRSPWCCGSGNRRAPAHSTGRISGILPMRPCGSSYDVEVAGTMEQDLVLALAHFLLADVLRACCGASAIVSLRCDVSTSFRLRLESVDLALNVLEPLQRSAELLLPEVQRADIHGLIALRPV